MRIIYIKKKDIISLKSRLFNKIESVTKDDKIFFHVPIYAKTTNKKIKRIAKKINKLLYIENSNTIVLSNDLLKNDLLKNELCAHNINIINGRMLFRVLKYKILEKIYEYKGQDIKTGKIAILVNDNTILNTCDLLNIARKIKNLNIVTDNINKFKPLEEYLYKELGIIIRISNNKKRALQKAEIILNIDFPEEQINEYVLPEKGVIVNFNNKIKINSKRFNGINIQDYRIYIPKQYKIEGFSDEFIYESIIYKMDLQKAREKIEKDKVCIKSLIGSNGDIDIKEFK